ncbi:acyl-CoA thioesterase domain-containing protein [Microbacterium sp. No. 7]|uniref:acyl-CoA thioesterase domain-containing protein n=1 Tax=Microbacterium sp. No. 7 TaxID=1714373 RepID=UPI0006D0F69E|nr:acyl-CoA thioesterase domain-containing protein [Microbacterium sp. No. 7]ALJ19272.1 hypothetical protein AOA12_04880 [Microbacterium sp. No. 7]
MTHPEQRLGYYLSTDEPGLFLPQDIGIAGWKPDQLHGPAITGLLTRTAIVEAEARGLEQRLVRAGFELFARARLVPTHVRADVVRSGARVTLIDVVLSQEGRDVARGHFFFAVAAGSPGNDLWLPGLDVAPPPAGVGHDRQWRVHHSAQTGWTTDVTTLAGGVRRGLWQYAIDLVDGERVSGDVLAGFVSDITSFAVNAGSRGLQHINIDANLNISRSPVGGGVGIVATHVSENDGISVGSAVMFDERGPFAVTSLTGISHSRTS